MSLKGMLKKTAPDILLRTVRARRAWREHEKTRPVWQRIDQELLEEARLVSDVLEMLDRMPKGGVVAEIGVAEGKLSQEILKRTAPRKLYLVDPWDVDTFDAYSEQSFVALKSKFEKEIEFLVAWSFDADTPVLSCRPFRKTISTGCTWTRHMTTTM